MGQPLLHEDGRLVRPPLLGFERYIEDGMSCILKLMFDQEEDGRSRAVVQFAMTPEQCRDIANHLLMCADVIELERPTLAQ